MGGQNRQNSTCANGRPYNSVTNTKSVLHQVAGIIVLFDLIAPPNPIQNDVTKITSVAIGLTKQQQHRPGMIVRVCLVGREAYVLIS